MVNNKHNGYGKANSNPKSFCDGDVVKWYYENPPKLDHIPSKIINPANATKKRELLPYHQWIFRSSFLYNNFYESRDYTFTRVKGMVVHETIDYFIDDKLPAIPLYFTSEISYYRLWYFLRRSLYLSLHQKLKDMKVGLPQIKIWFPFLLDECMKSLDLFLEHIFNSCMERLILNHSLDLILEDFTPIIHERTHAITYRGYHISFKPDWIVFELNKAIIIDYKTGHYYAWRIEKDRLQVLLFAWLFEKYFNIKVDRCEVHYMDAGKSEIFEFTTDIRNEIQGKLDVFINNQELKNNYQNPSKMTKRFKSISDIIKT